MPRRAAISARTSSPAASCPTSPISTAVPPERRDVAGDIAGAAEHALRPPQQQHRHRRLGRDALGIAIGEAVEHDVAKTQDRGVREIHAVCRSGQVAPSLSSTRGGTRPGTAARAIETGKPQAPGRSSAAGIVDRQHLHLVRGQPRGDAAHAMIDVVVTLAICEGEQAGLADIAHIDR